MSIPCLPTETSYDVQCPVCGRGFLLLTPPTLAISRSTQRRSVRQGLAAQHEFRNAWSNAHPSEVFDLPGWDGVPEKRPTLGRGVNLRAICGSAS
jgi:hypothetical protein